MTKTETKRNSGETNSIKREDNIKPGWVNRLDGFKFSENLSAEVAVLGSFLLNPERINECKHLLNPEDFTEELFQAIYSKICELYFSKTPVDEITLAVELKKMSAFKNINIDLLLCSIMCNVGCSANAIYYAKIVAQHSISKQLTGTLSEATQLICDGHLDDVNLEELKDKIALLKNQGVTELSKSIIQIMKKEDDMSAEFISTGYENFNNALGGGICLGDFTALAGAPGTGKSQFAINLMTKANIEGKPARVLFICQEMNDKTIMDRFIGSLTGIPLNACKGLRKGTATDSTWEKFGSKFQKGIEALAKLPFIIHTTGCLTIEELQAIIAKNINNVDMIVLDYLQQIRNKQKQTNYEKANEVSYTCMDVARKYKKAVIALSQFNREGYKDNVRPTMASLRDSGQLEQDAANVWLLWRDADDKPSLDAAGRQEAITLELNMAKNRNGATGNTYFDYKMDCGRIRESLGYH